MPFAVLSSFFGLISSFFGAVSALRHKQWLELIYKTVFVLGSVIGFISVLHSNTRYNKLHKQAA